MTAPTRLAIRVFERILASQTSWQCEGVDYDALDRGPKKYGFPRVGDERVITFMVRRTPFIKVYLRLSANWGWEAYSYSYKELLWFDSPMGFNPKEASFASDYRNPPYMDYYRFGEVWTSVPLAPPVTQYPGII